MDAPRLADWSHEKTACIDWNHAGEVLAGNFTLLQLCEMHPKLQKLVADGGLDPAVRARWSRALLSSDDEDLRRQVVDELISQDVFTLRNERWCARCGVEGHTRSSCQLVNPLIHPSIGDAAPGTAKMQYQEHLQLVERLRLVSEKLAKKQVAQRPMAAGARGNYAAAASGPAAPLSDDTRWAMAGGMDDRHRGVLTKIDLERGFGNVVVGDGIGELRFFLDRCEYGLKKMCVNDVVTVRVDSHREFPMACEIRPEKAGLTTEDAHYFLGICAKSVRPMLQIETIVSHRYDWPAFWLAIPEGSLSAATHTIVALATFVGNKEPIHLPIFQRFLSILQSSVTLATGATAAFFPDLIVRAAKEIASINTSSRKLDAADGGGSGRSGAVPTLDQLADQLLEMSTLCLAIRQHTDATTAAMTAVVAALDASIGKLGDGPSSGGLPPASQRVLKRKLAVAQQRAAASAGLTIKACAFPSAAELSKPSDLPDSIFNWRNLPVLGGASQTGVAECIDAHCKLLRADTFEAVSRVLAASCFTLPNYVPSEETMVDCAHARVYSNLTFAGRVVTRDRDFVRPDSFLLQLQERKPTPGGLFSRLADGTCVCITTGMDRTLLDSDEIFWGVISSSNVNLLRAGIVVVYPLPGQDFTAMAQKLNRNERANVAEQCSLMLETTVFVPGYVPVFQALYSFVGPAGMPLPLSKQVLTPSPENVNSTSPLVSYVPPHAKYLMDSLIQRIRNTFTLDSGQDEAMRKLATSEALLIQGPPGTGKSFIGARLVEVYVRYKQQLSTGDFFAVADVDAMPSTRIDSLVPKLGPVVVITYKNHALDEFLLDLLHADMWDDDATRTGLSSDGSTVRAEYFPRGRRIVRVGTMSREPELVPYTLATMMQQRYVDKFVLNGLREKIFLMNQRLEKIAKEIQHLERGNVPRSYFDRWLTAEQRSSIRYEDRESWLAGDNFLAKDPAQHQVPKTHYLTLLRTRVASSLQQASTAQVPANDPATAAAGENDADDADTDEDAVQLSVFQAMRREDENKERNEALHTTYISAEALECADHPPQLPKDIPAGLQSLWSLSPRLRHEYYAYLIQQAIGTKARDWKKIVEALQMTVALRNHAIDEARLELLRGADVVGFTTSGCALNQNLLRSLRPSVLVVEEAAEVLESQLLACMTDSLKQIILIGDHFQLKPKVDTLMYEKHNHMNLSMFERIARRATPIRLVEQRRMHPALSQLIRPFYTEQPLLDHASLLKRYFLDSSGNKHVDTVPGLAHRIFLWRHDKEEEQMPQSLSKINTCEIRMTTSLVAHLLAEGVSPKSITVITPYLGQFRAVRSALRIDGVQSMSDVRVSTVDLFQGDESDIIILSLVRTKKLTEFLRMRNRMIVACSRARFAMVILGNDSLLRQSPHWSQVLAQLDEHRLIGDLLPITTSTQPGRVLYASSKDAWPTKKRARASGGSTSTE